MRNNVFFLGCTQNYGYDFSATNTKTELMARGLQEAGDVCLVHNGIIGKKDLSCSHECVKREYFNVITVKKRGNQLISWLFNLPSLYTDLKKSKKTDYNNIVVLEAPDYHIFLIYVLLAKILSFKVVVISHEWLPTVKSIHLLRRPSSWLYTKTFGYLADAVLPISEYIIRKIEHFKVPYMKVPVLSDYDLNVKDCHIDIDNYFLYCVYAAYTRDIFVMIDAFHLYRKQGGKSSLVLVLGGSDAQVEVVREYIKSSGVEGIFIKRRLPYIELFGMYKHSKGLIIPLDRKCEQDYARFSQKIAEYTSVGVPLITNDVGEVHEYFKSTVDAIFASGFDAKGFCDAFHWIDSHPEDAKNIGRRGRNIGETYFNYRLIGTKLSDFFSEI